MKVEALSCPNCGGSVRTDMDQCPYCGSNLIIKPLGNHENLKPQNLDWISLGKNLRINHPQRGAIMVQVIGQVIYAELWQKTKNGPWDLTGNYFVGFWLDADCFLLNWQNRYYLLDQKFEVSDPEIRKDFAPYARRFGQSDQTAQVDFKYSGKQWRIIDIGKFQIGMVKGKGIEFQPGAVGRFIHASSDGQRALVVEDHESSGRGQDNVWLGYQIQEKDIA